MLAVGALALILLTSCAMPFSWRPTPALEKLPALKGDWQITFTQSGGFIGLSRALAIASDGQTTATDDRTQKTVSGRLSAADLAALKDLVAATRYRTVTSQVGCADCFYYQLQINASGGSFAAGMIQLSVPGSGLDPLIGFLQNQMVSLLGN
jgi:hypothetical protein